MKSSVATIFEQKPEQWGLRGDPYLWDDLQASFSTTLLPCSESLFIELFKKYFKELTNHSFDLEVNSIEVEKYDHGGMSSGMISMEFWKKEALPLLLQRLQIQ